MTSTPTREQLLRILQGHIDGLHSSAAVFEQQRIAQIAGARDSAAQRDAALERATEYATELEQLRAELGIPDADDDLPNDPSPDPEPEPEPEPTENTDPGVPDAPSTGTEGDLTS